ncbi:MAG: MBL fold metallo-hydrolase [Bryobacteraceae bacterium]
MKQKLLAAAVVFGLAGMATAQDAKTVLQTAANALGAANMNSIQITGTGHLASLGQNHLPTAPWPETNLTAYTRTVDFAAKSSKEELTRNNQNPPAKGGGAPFADGQKQVNFVSGQYAWNQPGAQPQPAIAAAEERQLQIWLTPQGFVKGAMEANATAKKSKGGTDVTFTALSKYKVTGTIDAQGMVTKVNTRMAHPVLGDMLIETLYSGYKDFGGVKFPARIVQNQGGFPVWDFDVTEVKANPGSLGLTVPDAVRTATVPPVRAVSEKLGDGVWFISGGSHNSVVVEFKDYVTVIETPLTEERADAVLAEAKKLVPNKPIKYVINSHHHFDHSGGLRTAVAEGIPIITQEQNKAFYEQAWKAPHTMDPDKLYKSPKKAKFITVKDKYEITDGNQTIALYFIEGNNHNGDMMMAYLPKQKVLVEADLFTPPAPGTALVPVAAAFANTLYDNVQRLKLDIATIAPLHGRPVPYSDFPKAIGK